MPSEAKSLGEYLWEGFVLQMLGILRVGFLVFNKAYFYSASSEIFWINNIKETGCQCRKLLSSEAMPDTTERALAAMKAQVWPASWPLGIATFIILFLSPPSPTADIPSITNCKDQSKFLFSAKICLCSFYPINFVALQSIHGAYISVHIKDNLFMYFGICLIEMLFWSPLLDSKYASWDDQIVTMAT